MALQERFVELKKTNTKSEDCFPTLQQIDINLAKEMRSQHVTNTHQSVSLLLSQQGAKEIRED